MSRITTDDCKEQFSNHFELAYHAAQRAYQILKRDDAKVSREDDKPIVTALREVSKNLHTANASPPASSAAGD